jgi:hypothetical protein
MPDTVECRSDTSYAGEPVAIYLHGERIPVLQVVASWRTPQDICYRVITFGMKIVDCNYSEIDDAWTINEV